MQIATRTLCGHFVQLEPVETTHRADLALPAADERIWQHTLLGPSFDAYFDALLALRTTGTHIPFVVRSLRTGELVGATRLMDIVPEHRRVEIGGTWYHPDSWGGPTNPEAKYLLLRHAFDESGANRVQLLTDVRNERSQAAISKLGAIREGVLRSHMIVTNGRRRDSVLFSIIAEQWDAVRTNLEQRLSVFR
jgi:RimJ/RimL family protein N-acetyltransferase